MEDIESGILEYFAFLSEEVVRVSSRKFEDPWKGLCYF